MNPNEPSKPPEMPDSETPHVAPAAVPAPIVSVPPPIAANFTVEARARYDDEVPPVPKPVSPDRVRKPTVVDKATLVAPLVVDRPPAVKDAVGDMPVSGGLDPSPFVPVRPSGTMGFLNTLMAIVGLVVLLPVAALLFLAIDCALSGNSGGKW